MDLPGLLGGQTALPDGGVHRSPAPPGHGLDRGTFIALVAAKAQAPGVEPSLQVDEPAPPGTGREPNRVAGQPPDGAPEPEPVAKPGGEFQPGFLGGPAPAPPVHNPAAAPLPGLTAPLQTTAADVAKADTAVIVLGAQIAGDQIAGERWVMEPPDATILPLIGTPKAPGPAVSPKAEPAPAEGRAQVPPESTAPPPAGRPPFAAEKVAPAFPALKVSAPVLPSTAPVHGTPAPITPMPATPAPATPALATPAPGHGAAETTISVPIKPAVPAPAPKIQYKTASVTAASTGKAPEAAGPPLAAGTDHRGPVITPAERGPANPPASLDRTAVDLSASIAGSTERARLLSPLRNHPPVPKVNPAASRQALVERAPPPHPNGLIDHPAPQVTLPQAAHNGSGPAVVEAVATAIGGSAVEPGDTGSAVSTAASGQSRQVSVHPFFAPPPGSAEMARIAAPQIAVAVGANPGAGRIEIRLDPPELGNLEIVLEIVEQSLRATLAAERPATGELLRRHSEILLAQLQNAGFEDVDLHFSDDRSSGNPEARPDREDRPSHGHGGDAAGSETALAANQRARAGTSGGGLDLRL